MYAEYLFQFGMDVFQETDKKHKTTHFPEGTFFTSTHPRLLSSFVMN